MLLNSMIYPSVSSAVYFIFTMTLTMMSLKRNEKTINTKFIIAIVFLLMAFGQSIAKGVFLIILNHEG